MNDWNMPRNYWETISGHYADFNGRMDRRAFWCFMLVHLGIYAALVLLGVSARGDSPLLFLPVIYILLLFLPSLSAEVRRLHDSGLSGWNLLFGIIPYIGPIIVIVLLCKAGDSLSNQYGSRIVKAKDPAPNPIVPAQVEHIAPRIAQDPAPVAAPLIPDELAALILDRTEKEIDEMRAWVVKAAAAGIPLGQIIDTVAATGWPRRFAEWYAPAALGHKSVVASHSPRPA